MLVAMTIFNIKSVTTQVFQYQLAKIIDTFRLLRFNWVDVSIGRLDQLKAFLFIVSAEIILPEILCIEIFEPETRVFDCFAQRGPSRACTSRELYEVEVFT